MGESTTLPTNIANGDAGHAGKHNAANTQINWLTSVGRSIPLTSANSGTAATVTAPTHGEARLKLTLTGNATITLTGGTAGEVCSVQLHLVQDGTGSRTVTWPTNIDWGLNGAPVLSSAAGKADRVYLTTEDGGASFQGALVGTGYSTPAAPAAPTGLTATGGTTGEIVLNWTQGAANGSTVTGNKIYRGTVSGTLTLLATVAAGTTYTDATTTDGTPYYYKVTALNAIGESSRSSEATASSGITTIAADPFTRADATGTTPSNGLIGQATPTGAKTWLNFTGSGAWSVSANGAICSNGVRFAGIDAGVANCSVSAQVATTGALADHGLVFRYVDANNYCTVIIDSGGYYIQKTIGGTVTNVDHGGGTLASDLTVNLKVVLNGSTVTVFADGVQVATGTIADAAVLTATKHGLATGSNANVKFDNFLVTVP